MIKKGERVGDIFILNDVAYVVVEVSAGGLCRWEQLEEYVAKNYVITMNGESRTIKEIIQEQCHLMIHNRGTFH